MGKSKQYENQQEEISSMPGIYRYTLDLLLKEIAEAAGLGINAIALFPLIATDKKDNAGRIRFPLAR